VAAERGDYAAYWRERAACLREDPDLFFPVGNGGLTPARIDEAKAVCGRCPVVEQCLELALKSGQADGVWGGTTESERRSMSRRAARPGSDAVTPAA